MLSDKDLIEGIKEKRKEGLGMLTIVKWVWDNCNRGLKDSKTFVDNN